MKIKMTKDTYTSTNQLVWSKGQEFDVVEDTNTYYKLVEMNSEMYGVSKDYVNELFEVVG